MLTSPRLLLLLKVFIWEELEFLTDTMYQLRLEGLAGGEELLTLLLFQARSSMDRHAEGKYT